MLVKNFSVVSSSGKWSFSGSSFIIYATMCGISVTAIVLHSKDYISYCMIKNIPETKVSFGVCCSSESLVP